MAALDRHVDRHVDRHAELPVDVQHVLRSYRIGRFDPTTRLTPTSFTRATLTPHGPGTLHLSWANGSLTAQAWGDGGEWLVERVPHITGALDPGHVFVAAHPAIMAAQRRHPHQRFGASGTLYHELLPTILAQRITAREATVQWHRLVIELGRPAPGPHELRLPPAPDDVLAKPRWWFHPRGIEERRAAALHGACRHADRLFEWAALPPARAADRLAQLPGLGCWTIGSVLGPAMGDPDAVAIGDYHLKHTVVNALTGRPRGTDDEMLALLEPFAGQRGRAVRLLLRAGHRAPAFGPRQRVLPMQLW